MANKWFCDECGKEITGTRLSLTVYDAKKDKNIVEKDLCGACSYKYENKEDVTPQRKKKQ